jgi:VanZ family protein
LRQIALNSSITRLKDWIPAILVAAMISSFSTHYFSDQQTSRIIVPVLHWLLPWADAHLLHRLHVGIRKLAHVTEFAIFSTAVFHGIRGHRYGWRWTWALATLLIAGAYAGADEWHQSFVAFRHSSVRDAAIDTFGALLAQGMVWAYSIWKGASAEKSVTLAARELVVRPKN